MRDSLLVAVYGTLRAGFGNHTLLNGAVLVGQGRTVPEFTMLSAGFPVCLQGDTGAPKAPAVVEVYDLGAAPDPERVLNRLDTLEGHPDWYQRQPIEVVLDSGKKCTAWMYIMPGDVTDFPSWRHVQSGDYAKHRYEVQHG